MVSLVVCAVLFPAAASGADTIFWNNGSTPRIATANADGSEARNLSFTARAGGSVTLNGLGGLVFDSNSGRLYWANQITPTIATAKLNGSDAFDVVSAAAGAPVTMKRPFGLAVDPAGDRIYWVNFRGTEISTAKLDGTDAHDLTLVPRAGASVTVSEPVGITIDPVAGRIYWTSHTGTISTARLDGSDAHDLSIDPAQATLRPVALVLNPAEERIYWVNTTPATISTAKLDGTDAHDLTLVPRAGATATLNLPNGLALDPVAGQIYWTNATANKISSANLDGTDAHDLAIDPAKATLISPDALILFSSPSGVTPPIIAGGTAARSVLSCSQGTWAPDFISSYLYRAPQSFAFQWSLDGQDIAGATESSVTATSGGDYRCRVTARNPAGAAVQTSDPHHVTPLAGFGGDPLVTLTLLSPRVAAGGPIKIGVSNANAFQVAGTLSGQTTTRAVAGRRVKLGTKPLSLGPNARATIKLKLPKPLQRLFGQRHSISLSLRATVTDPAGNRRVVSKTVKPRLRARRGG